MKLAFLGAAGTVTGSRYLLESGARRYLVDCGLFQGLKPLRLRNWEPFPFDPQSLSAVLLTHAHLDHSGYLPLLVKNGFRGPIWCSSSTKDLCEILLPDSGFLQERDAEFANRHGYSKHRPAAPLYTEQDAHKALDLLRTFPFDVCQAIDVHTTIVMRRTGHILGAASIELCCEGLTTVFSGDLGRYDDQIFNDPSPVYAADYLVIESTYGDRQHDRTDPSRVLAEIITRTVGRGGTVVIPSFAVGRAQSLLVRINGLKAAGHLGNVPVFLDSPMAVDASELFCRNVEDHRLTERECRSACAAATYVRSVDESKALTANPMPKIIVSASGMVTGGRVLHHLKRYAPEPRNTIVFAGFQAPGTRGAAMIEGAKFVRIHGEEIPVRAEIQSLSMLSAHGDSDELLRWCRNFRGIPRLTFVTHGEPRSADALSTRLGRELGWKCRAPEHLEEFNLS